METFSTRRSYRSLLIFYTLAIVLVGAAVAAAWVFFVFPTSLGEDYGSVIATVQQMQNILLGKVAVIYVVMSVFMIGALIVLHLFYSHRIAGPAYRLSKEASIIAKGDLTGNICFRQKDNLTDMADTLNQVASRYRGRVTALKDYVTIIEAQVNLMQQLAQKGEQTAALEKNMEEVRSNLKNIGQVLSEVRT
jgi:methyl-accepting chemotaxis protein